MRIVNLNLCDMNEWNDPRSMLVYTTQAINQELIRAIRKRFPDITIVGMSSLHGILLQEGFRRGTYGLLFEKKDNMLLRSMVIEFSGEEDVRTRVSSELKSWSEDSSQTAHLFIHSPQGSEERIIEGIHDAFGDGARIFGATPGNDRFLPEAYCFINDRIVTRGVIIVQMLSEQFFCRIECGGYMTTPKKGIVTEAEGRIIRRIDGKSAAEIYNQWTEKMFDAYMQRRSPLPRSAGLYPLARTLEVDPDCGFWLSHVYKADLETGELYLYSEIASGTQVQLMRGTESSIISHVGTAIKNTLSEVDQSKVEAALIMFCAGCASIIADRMNSVCEQASLAFGDIPFLGCTTYGEQGRLSGARQDHHGNMMIEFMLLLRS